MFTDLRLAFRSLLHAPRFAAMAISVLALGIGANSAMFTIVDSILLRPLPYGDPQRVAVVLATSERSGGMMPVTPGDFQDFREQNHSFEQLGAAHVWSPTLTGIDRAERIEGLRASSDLFDILKVSPALGRFFSKEDGRPNSANVVVLTHGLFQRRFGGAASVIGQDITLDGKKYTIIGVTPEGFHFPPFWATNAEMFSAGEFRPEGEASRGPGYLRLFGRLKPGVSIDQANADLRTIAARLAASYPRTNAGLTTTVTPIHEMAVGRIRPVLLVLFGAVACTLLIACANVANLLVARASSRSKEIAIRQSLGATRSSLVRLFLAESLALAACGGLAGLALAWWAVPAFTSSIPELTAFRLPRRTEIHLSSGVVLFNAALCLAKALFCGLITAWQTRRVDLNGALKAGGRGGAGTRSGRRMRFALTTAEIAIALLLLSGAGLLIESYRKLSSVDPGFDPAGVIAVNVGLAASQHSAPDKRAQFYQEALRELSSLPGVTNVSAVNHVPLAGDRFGTQLTIQDHPAVRPEDTPNAVYRVATPGYLKTMRMRLLHGRDFTPADNESSEGVVILNASAAKRFWPGQNPIGKRLHRGDAQAQRPWLTVVGVVADVKQSDWAVSADNEVYLPFDQDADYRHNPASFLTMTLVIRAGNASGLGAAIRDRIATIDRNVSTPGIFLMDQVIRDVTWQPRTSMMLVMFFGAFAALLAAVGIYAVMSFLVAGRTREIGVRMALGARRFDVVRTVVRDAAPPAVIGLALGLGLAAMLTRFMSTMLYEVKPLDATVFAGVTGLIACVVAGACLAPARRAANLDPLEALRQD